MHLVIAFFFTCYPLCNWSLIFSSSVCSSFFDHRYGLDATASSLFHNPEGSGRTAEAVRKAIEFEKYLVGAQVHDVLFEPCGYSLNALKDDTYVILSRVLVLFEVRL